MVGFNYRRVPAVTLAHKLVTDGRLGAVRHIRAQYLQDWLTDPEYAVLRHRLEAALVEARRRVRLNERHGE